MFPKVKFILYDGAKFDSVLKKYPNVFELHTEFVDVPLIKKLKKMRFLQEDCDRMIFLSDIRRGNDDHDVFEKNVEKDMRLQEQWVKILKPALTLLKFRLPYGIDKYTYMKGDIYLQIWPPKHSAETRLLVRQKDIGKSKKYNCTKYDNALFFHNKYDRVYCYGEKDIIPELRDFIIKKNLYCPCYDCVGELKILHEYASVMNKDINSIIHLIHNYMNKIGKDIFKNHLNKNKLIPLNLK
jgi:hypothetical protein